MLSVKRDLGLVDETLVVTKPDALPGNISFWLGRLYDLIARRPVNGRTDRDGIIHRPKFDSDLIDVRRWRRGWFDGLPRGLVRVAGRGRRVGLILYVTDDE